MLNVEYITNSIFNSRTYILSTQGSDVVWLVDCGDSDRVLAIIKEKRVEGVLLTHTHSDHIYGLVTLLEEFPDVKVFTNSYGIKAMRSPQLNLSRYHSEYPDISIEKEKNIYPLSEGNQIEALHTRITVLETPGHDPSCLTYIIEDLIFTGDSFIPGQKVFTGFPYSNKLKAAESVDRITRLAKNLAIMPGHTIKQ